MYTYIYKYKHICTNLFTDGVRLQDLNHAITWHQRPVQNHISRLTDAVEYTSHLSGRSEIKKL